MSDVCNFCGVFHPPSNIRNLEDAGLMVSLKFSEAFKISLPENFKIICIDCLNRLNESFNFFTQVQNCLRNFTEIKPELVTVKVEMEPLPFLLETFPPEHDDCENKTEEERLQLAETDSLSLPKPGADLVRREKGKRKIKQPIKFRYQIPIKPKIELKDIREIVSPRQTKKSCELKNPTPTGPPKDEKGFKKTNRQNQGRTGREIFMKDIFKTEIEKNIFSSPVVSMELCEEDKLENGMISLNAKNRINEKVWNDYWWNCTEEGCDQQNDNILDLSGHLRRKHSKKKFSSTCIDCSKDIPNHAVYLNHALTHHPNLKFCCLFCSEYRHNFRDLYLHCAEVHSDKKPVFCLYCGKFELSGTTISIHVEKYHRTAEPKLECDICGVKKMFKPDMSTHLRQHMQAHLLCDVCLKLFKTPELLLIHKKNSHSSDSIICAECGNIYKNQSTMKRHIRAKHTPNLVPKRFPCEICQRVFKSKLNLTAHMIVHDKTEGKLECSYCDRRFKRVGSLQYHVRCTHTGEKPFKCCMPNCSLRFYDYANCRKHIHSAHDGEGKPIKGK